jgi:hypothetical protein
LVKTQSGRGVLRAKDGETSTHLRDKTWRIRAYNLFATSDITLFAVKEQ